MKHLDPSYHQERLWFIEYFEKGKVYTHAPVYHNALIAISISGHVDEELLQQAIETIIGHYDILHTRLITKDRQPCVEQVSAYQFKLQINRAGATVKDEENFRKELIELAQQPMDIDGPLLLKAALYCFNEQRATLAIVLHHAIADQFTLGWLANRIFDYYALLEAGNEIQLPGLALRYDEFAAWQKQLPEDTMDELLFYWRKQLNHGRLEALQLPTDFMRDPFHVYNAGFEQICFNAAETAMQNAYCKKNSCTRKELLFTVFSILMFRYSGQEEIVIGMPVNSRERHSIADLPGPVTNLVALKTSPAAEIPGSTYLDHCKKVIADAELYSDMPFDKLALELALEKDMSRTVLFDVLFQYEKEPLPRQAGKLHITFDLPNVGWGKYDLNLLFCEKQGKELSGKLTYNTRLYKQDSIQRMLVHFRQLLASFVKESFKTIGTFEYLTREEKKKILEDWNNTAAAYPEELTIHKRIEQQSVLFPGNTAVIFAGQQFTYRQLNEQANILAWHLKNNCNFKRGDFAGILLERSAFIPLSILAILKAGGTYIPLDPSHPAERVNYILKDSACKILLTQTSSRKKFLEEYKYTIIEISEIDFSSGNTTDLPPVNEPSDTAYIIYTSGTTGHPKGCMVTHENVIRLLVNDMLPFSFGNEDVWIMAHSYCFDFSVWEMYGALFYGGKLVIPAWEDVRDTNRWLKVLKHYRVTVLNQTPAAFYLLAKEEKEQEVNDLHHHLRYVCFGGERLELSYLKDWISIYPPDRLRLVNMYGITETTVHVTWHFITVEDIARLNGRSIVGKPLPETTLYIFDPLLQPVSPGVKGEIYVGGTGVCKGYLGKEILTAERFIPDPYSQGGRLYKTGDTGCFRIDGNVEYIGRNDSQVKIRGYRIEPAEIENVILTHPNVDKVLVTTRIDKDKLNSLAVYYTLSVKEEMVDMRAFLRNKLPEYMVPSFYIVIDSFPLTANGKIDTRLLPDPENTTKTASKSREILTQMERELQATWMQVLNRDTVGVNENFFEIGGHSLKAVQLISAIHKKTGIQLELQDIFQHVTIEALAAFMEGCVKTTFNPIKRTKEQEYYELSHAQLRLYTLSQTAAGSVAYNMPAAIRMNKPLSSSLINEILKVLTGRHESLRTVFVNIDGKPWQKIIPAAAFSLNAEWIDIREYTGKQELLKQLQSEESTRQFDFANGPLMRIKVLRLQENEHIILCTMHHIISDGISIQVLMREMLQLYRDFSNGLENSLPELKLQYRDYAAWHNQEISGKVEPNGAAVFWKNYLNGINGEPDLPLDGTRAGQRNYKGGNERYIFDHDVTSKLATFNKEHGTTLYMTIMAVLKILLYKYTGGQDIIVGTAVSGRNHPDLASQVGLYVNTIAVRDKVDPCLQFSSFLQLVRENLLTVYRYQDYPFDKLLNDLEIVPHPNRHPLFDVMLNEPPSSDDMLSELDGAEPVDLVDEDMATAKFDLLFSIVNKNDHIEIGIEYDTTLFGAASITRMLVHFCNLLNQAIETPGKTISEMNAMDETETRAVEQAAFKYLRNKTEPIRPLHILKQYGSSRIYVNDIAHTYEELLDESQNLANGLSAAGIKPGDYLACCLDDQWYRLITQIALLRLQCISVPLPAETTEPLANKIGKQIKLAGWIADKEIHFKTECPVFAISSLQKPVPGENVITVACSKYSLYASCVFHPSQDLSFTVVNTDEYFNFCSALQLSAGFDLSSVVYACDDDRYSMFFIAILPALFSGADIVIQKNSVDSIARFEKLADKYKITHAFLSNKQWYQWRGSELSIPSLEYLLGNNLQQKNSSLIKNIHGKNFYGILNLSGSVSTLNFYYSLQKPGELLPELPEVKPLGNRVLTIRNSWKQLVPLNIASDIYFDYNGLQEPVASFAGNDRARWLSNGYLQIQYYNPSIVLMDGMMLNKTGLERFITKHLKCIDCCIVNLDPGSNCDYVLIIATVQKLTKAGLARMLSELLPASFLELASIVNLPAIPVNHSGMPDKYLLRKMGIDGSVQAEILKGELEKSVDVQECLVDDVLQPVAGAGIDAEMILEEYWWNKQVKNSKAEDDENNILPESNKKAYSSGGELVIDPDSPVTLTQALLRTAELYPRKGITFILQDGTESFLSYPEMLKEAKCVLTGLRKAGLNSGDRVLLQIRESNRHFSVFWGCVLGGIIPVTIAVPHTYRSGNAVLSKLLNTWQLLDASAILCSEALMEDIAECGREMNSSLNAFSVSELLNNDPAENLYKALPDDLVFFQLSSGSTGVPKCIQEKHSSIIWHILSSANYCGYTSDDITLNWLPFDHVVPTLTFHLKDVYLGISQTELETNIVLSTPLKWLDYMEKFSVTHSWSPNFGFKLVADELAVKTGTWNLSSLKFLMNAGEQVTLSVVKRFLESTAPFGIVPAVMQPAFGMAEVCTCMTYENDFSFDKIHYVKKNSLSGKLQFVKSADSTTTSFVELGPPSSGHEIRITDEYNKLVEEGVIGRFQIRGGSVTPGYVNNPEANYEAFVGDGWFNSGDLGFIRNGRLTLTGREKETIIIRGANFYCYELEDEVGFVEGVLSTYVASCGIQNRTAGTEELVLFYSPDPLIALDSRLTIKRIREAITRKFGVNPAFVIPINAADFLKTTSGKIQRKKMKELFEAGHFDKVIMDTGQEKTGNDLPQFFYEKTWQKKKRNANPLPRKKRILVFLTDDLLLPAENDGGCGYINVFPGETFLQTGESCFIISPADETNYQLLFEQLKLTEQLPDQVIHLWNYREITAIPISKQDIQDSNLTGLYSIHAMVKAMLKTGILLPLMIVTSGMQEVVKTDKTYCGSSTLPGFVKTILQEQPEMNCKLVDIPFTDKPNLLNILLAELMQHDGETELAYRAGIRYISGLRKIRIPADIKLNIPVIQGGLYLLTGGLGGAGKRIAKELLLHFNISLLIIGRTDFEALPMDQWTEDVKEKWDTYQSFSKTGQVIYRSLNVEDVVSLKSAVVETELIFQKMLSGIFHLAGELDDHAKHWKEVDQNLLHYKIRNDFEKMFSAKIYGTIALNELIAAKPGLLFAAFSSVNSYFGAYSYPEYAAASSFLDYFIQYQRSYQQTKAMVINWSMWEDTGMNRNNHMKTIITSKGFTAIPPDQAVQSFWLAMGLQLAQVFVGLDSKNWNIQKHLDVERYFKAGINVYYTAEKEKVSEQALLNIINKTNGGLRLPVRVKQVAQQFLLPGGGIDKENLDIFSGDDHFFAYTPPVTENERKLAKFFHEMLEQRTIGITDSFFEMGVNSVKLASIISSLQELFPGRISISDLFEKPTIQLLAAMLDSQEQEPAEIKIKKLNKLKF